MVIDAFAAAIFLPLLSAMLAGFSGHILGEKLTQFLSCTLLILSAICGVVIFNDIALAGETKIVTLLSWVNLENLKANWTLYFDTLTAVMVLVVTVVSTIVHLFSVGYMHEDAGVNRFFAYLGLFTFAMLMLVTADNLLQMFFGWEGVGLASYLLIGFWYEKQSANRAAMKAFLVNRVGDFGFALGIFAVFLLFGTIEFADIFANAGAMEDKMILFAGHEFHALTVIGLLLFMGAMGKSAQLGLHTWLPDAMEGPTPVSALIHAATMVTAGVFMLARLSPVLEYAPMALEVVMFVGATTAFFAATVALVQNDIKKVIAYSTCSQLGYMFFAIGASAYGAAIFHLFTHAFFKALLFLAAGVVIHYAHHEQDMRKMGGLWKALPVTYVLMWVGNLALAGVPPFAGHYSKDMILESVWAAAHHGGGWVAHYAFWAGIVGAFLTAFYSWRLLMMTFHGASHVHETYNPPKIMIWPLLILGAGAILTGVLFANSFVGHDASYFWGNALFFAEHSLETLDAAHHAPLWVKKLPLVVAGAGILLAVLFYGVWRKVPGWFASTFKPIYNFLVHKWYFDELYDFVFVRGSQKLGSLLWRVFDINLIDRLGPNGMRDLAQFFARRVSHSQTGFVYHYAFVMLFGVTALIAWLYYGAGLLPAVMKGLFQ